MKGTVIRRLGPEDAQAWLDMRLLALKESPDAFVATLVEGVTSAGSPDRVAARLGDPASCTLGAFSPTRLMVAATLTRDLRAKVRHVGHLKGMYVTPEARRHGLGRRIVNELMGEGRRMGLKQVKLEVVSEDEPAIRLYEACGFGAYGREVRALEVDGRQWDMDLMVCFLDDIQGRTAR